MNYQYGYPAAPAMPPTEEQIREQKKLSERRELKRKCISTGLLCLITFFVLYTSALLFANIMSYALKGTVFLTDDKLSLIPDMLLNSIASLLGFGVVGVIFGKITKTDFSAIFPHKKISLKKLSAVVVIGYAVCIIANYIAQIFVTDLNLFGIDPSYSLGSTGSTSILEHIVYIVSVALVPAVTEELVYRGLVLGRLRKFGDGFALVTSALLFGLMHGNLVQAPFAFVVGLATGWALISTGSIIPSMLIHCFNNLMSVLADIAYENCGYLGISEDIVGMIFLIFYVGIFALAMIAVCKLSKRDKNFLKFQKYDGLLNFKERIKVFLTSATIIVFIVLCISECLLMLNVGT